MTTAVHRALIILATITFPISSAPPAPSKNPSSVAKIGFQVKLRHVDSGKNFTRLEFIQRAAKRSQWRMQRLHRASMIKAASESTFDDSIEAGNGEFLMDIAIGTPPVLFSAVVDTGSDLIWTQCEPCDNCFQQTTPIFDPAKSSSFSTLPCSSDLCTTALPISICSDGGCQYLYAYGDGSSTQGIMATETFEFGDVSLPEIAFGCGHNNGGISPGGGGGLVGLGRGPLSFVSQLDEKKFSYCLTTFASTATSTLSIGSRADLATTGGNAATETTPLITITSSPSYYYITLEGITVGNTYLDIEKSTFAIKPDGSGGMIIDSGTTLTYLPQEAFNALANEFTKQIKLPVYQGDSTGLNLCFSVASTTGKITVPDVVLHFAGAVDWKLPPENLIVASTNGEVVCLAMGISTGISILGNFQQQNTLVLYDLDNERISFIPTLCE